MIQPHHCDNRVLYSTNMYFRNADYICKIDGQKCDKYYGRNNSPDCPLKEDEG